MAPDEPVTIWATPALPLPPWVSAGHSTVEPGARVHVVGAASFSQLVKFCVVPEPSVRCATTMSVDGSLASGLSAAIAASSHLVICRWKILAIVSGDSCRSFTPSRLYAMVIGPSRIGKYRIGSAGLSAGGGAPSGAAEAAGFL